MEAVLKSDWKDEESFDAGVDDSVASTVFLTVDVVCSVVLPAAIEAVVVSCIVLFAVFSCFSHPINKEVCIWHYCRQIHTLKVYYVVY